jgi:hypothetical protein
MHGLENRPAKQKRIAGQRKNEEQICNNRKQIAGRGNRKMNLTGHNRIA